MAGHGVAPSDANGNETVLLMANYRDAAPGFHIGARNYAEWFRSNGIFDEVLLFVDCCRDGYSGRARENPFPTIERKRDEARKFYAMATGLHSKAWETCFNGEQRGIFSYSLMGALRSAALVDENGDLTGQVLASNLLATVPKLMLNQEPSIEYDNIVIAKRPAPRRPQAKIAFADKYAGMTASIFGKRYPEPDAVHVINAAPWTLNLDRFHYIVKVDGAALPQSFEVDGTREVVNVFFE
jgi:hypothetical protein